MEPSLATSTDFHIAAIRLLTQMQETINRLLDLTTPPSTEALRAAIPNFETVAALLEVSPQTTGDSNTGNAPMLPPAVNASDSNQEVRNPSTWYSVLVGRDPGVFRGSNGLTENIGGISKNLHHIHDSREAAVRTYLDALGSGGVVKVTLTETRKIMHESDEKVFVRE